MSGLGFKFPPTHLFIGSVGMFIAYFVYFCLIYNRRTHEREFIERLIFVNRRILLRSYSFRKIGRKKQKKEKLRERTHVQFASTFVCS